MSFLVQGRGRRATKIGSDDRELRLTTIESLAVAQIEPEFAGVAARGSRYGGGCQVIANGIAPVAAIPTTTATLMLYNTDDATGLAILVDYVSFCLGSGTPAAGATLWACITNGKPAAVPAAATNYSSQAITNTGLVSVARCATAITIPSGSAWFQVATSMQLAAANVGQGDSPAALRGILIPPGYGMGLAILSGAGTTPLYAISALWSELELDIEP